MKKLTNLDDVRAELAAQDALLHGATDGIDPEPETDSAEVDLLERVFTMRFDGKAPATRAVRPTHGFFLRV